MKTNQRIIEKVTLRDLELRLWVEDPVRAVYDGPILAGGQCWVEVAGPAGVLKIKTMQDLCATLRQVRAESLKQDEVAAIARIAGELLGVVRVATTHQIHAPLEDEFDVRLIDNIPRIEDGRLRFIATQNRLTPGVHGLEAIDIELANGHVARRDVPKRERNKIMA